MTAPFFGLTPQCAALALVQLTSGSAREMCLRVRPFLGGSDPGVSWSTGLVDWFGRLGDESQSGEVIGIRSMAMSR